MTLLPIDLTWPTEIKKILRGIAVSGNLEQIAQYDSIRLG
jgi:hypothetical protein